MPEIPEVQAHSERMTKALAGWTLHRFEPLNFAVLKTFNPPPDGAVGHRLVTVGRRAKYLMMEFDNGHRHVVHLMQGGRLRPDEKRSRKPKFGLARWVFTDDNGEDQAWLLTEAGTERKAGVWVVDGDPLPVEPLDRLGPEATGISRDELAELLGTHSRRIHGLLREQTVIAGLGRMLANEICYEAKLSPFANASKLDADEIDRLHAAIGTVVEAATDHERTLDDIGKSADRPSKVHNRAGEPCTGCDGTVHTVEYRRYTVYYCPTEQTGGKILADNTTSKFLK
ncbi:MAG: Fpg/Nei family DNA glycosylase [Acidimicrobiia bacterium]|nr:Fpg/Nei family DNA glycosylase [Acidimicrobiia bacterium]MDH5520445.1 Fpg/Nei family DNA glycosylase [Acidimicrobiia bacterium]